jgi:hypothetical protein
MDAVRFFFGDKEESYIALLPNDLKRLVNKFIERGIYKNSCYVFNDGKALLAAKRCEGEPNVSYIRWNQPRLVSVDALPFDYKRLVRHHCECEYYEEREKERARVQVRSSTVDALSNSKRFFEIAQDAPIKDSRKHLVPRHYWDGRPLYSNEWRWEAIDEGDQSDDDKTLYYYLVCL